MTNLLLLAVIFALIVTLVVRITAWLERPTNDQTLHVYDFTYMSDKGCVFVVTAVDVNDARQLLMADHGLSDVYIRHHVFLAHSEQVF